MAEAIELDFTSSYVKSPEQGPKVSGPLLDIKIKPETKIKSGSEANQEYQTNNYYGKDSLGIDVLKNKYLAPWEQHPWELWSRQA